MTDADYRHYILVIDRSGSMHRIRKDAEGGINQFVKDQAALPGKATLSLYQFDTEHEAVYSFISLSKARKYTLVPRGGTRLLDACGFAITSEGEKLAAMPEGERPGKVIVVVATDGDENDSREYSRSQIWCMTAEQQELYGWQFLYLGANQDAFAEAGGMGISAAATLNYAANSTGTQKAYAAASASVSRYVGGQSASLSYTDAERTAAADDQETGNA